MLLLHAGLVDDALQLWAERSTSGDDAPARFATRSELRRSVAPLLAGGAKALTGGPVVAWLPAVGGRALPSAHLVAVHDALATPDALAPQTIDALSVGASSWTALLRGCFGRALLADGVAAGADLAYWVRAFLFAAMLVGTQQYVPAIEQRREGAREALTARWRPRLAHAQRAALAALAASMPAACRALTTAGRPMPAISGRELLGRFISRSVDELVRSAAYGARAFAQQADGALHDRWMRALCTTDAEVAAKPADARVFAAQVAEWLGPVTREDQAEHRLCLRLEEPAAEGRPWFVRYLLQAHADPSLLVDAEQAWPKPLLRRAFLDGLGKAAGVSPPIQATLRQARPAGYPLDDAGAHAFLVQDASLLESAGFGVFLPAWWTSRGRNRLAVHAQVKRQPGASGGLRLDALVHVDWKVALGDDVLSAAELADLARLKVPLVRLRGRWVLVDADELRAALALHERRGTTPMQLAELVRMAVTGRAQESALAVERVVASGAIGTLLDRLDGRAAFAEQAVPASLRGTLRPYQRRGYSWLHFLSRLGLGACLADDMGLGKTITALALVARDWDADPSAPVLLVCPTSVIGNWQREIARFTPHLPVVLHHGGERSRRGRLLPRGERVAIVLTSYSVLLRDCERLRTMRWRGIVLDEAQNVKNAESKQARAARMLEAGYRVALTGTPIENHVGDLWALFEFLNPGLLGSAAAFRRDFQIPIAVLGDADAEARLRRTTGPFVLRRLKTDPAIVADLPTKLEMPVFCQLTKEQASLYAAVLRDIAEPLEGAAGIERRGLILAAMTKLKQVCNHPAQFLHDNSPLPARSGKLARLADMLEEVAAAGEHALVFTQFTEMAVLLQRYLQDTTGREVLYLHGGLAKRARDRIVERFQHDPDAPTTFVLSLRAGGTGLNLTRANHVFHFDRWWNPAVENQASDRAFRIGQRKNVQVRRLICAGTIEERIDALLERKGALANRLVRAGESGLTELSNAQLRELFALGPDAVATA